MVSLKQSENRPPGDASALQMKSLAEILQKNFRSEKLELLMKAESGITTC